MVKDQLFAEVFMVQHGWSTDGVYYDGVLGLGPKNGNSSMGTENLVTAMYHQGLIDENLFSLATPYNEGDVGEMILGGIPRDVDSDTIKWIPLSNKTFTFFDIRSSWQVSVSSVVVGDGTLVNTTIAPNSTAWVETEMPFIFLPDAMVNEIHTLIHAREIGWSPFYSVPRKRDEFPDIVFCFAGEEVKITGFDYTICDEGDCVSMLMGNGVDDLVVLGGGFLRGVKSIFDLEGDKVGCKFSAHLEYSAHPTNMLTTGHSFGTRSSRMKAGKGTFILC